MHLDKVWPLQDTVFLLPAVTTSLSQVSCLSPLSSLPQPPLLHVKTLRPIQGKWQVPVLRVGAKQVLKPLCSDSLCAQADECPGVRWRNLQVECGDRNGPGWSIAPTPFPCVAALTRLTYPPFWVGGFPPQTAMPTFSPSASLFGVIRLRWVKPVTLLGWQQAGVFTGCLLTGLGGLQAWCQGEQAPSSPCQTNWLLSSREQPPACFSEESLLS